MIQILALFALTHAIRIQNGPVIMAMGKPSWVLAINLGGLIAGIAGIALALPWGIDAVAAVVAGRAAVILPCFLLCVKRLTQATARELLGGYVVPLAGTVVLLLVASGVSFGLAELSQPLVRLLLAGAAGGVAYLVTVWLLSPSLVAEVQDLLWTALPQPMRSRLQRGSS